MQAIEIDLPQHRAVECLVAAGQIPVRHQQNDAREDAAAPADKPAEDVPTRDVPALDVSRAQHQVRPARQDGLQERRQEPHRVTEVGVDLDHDVGLPSQNVPEGGHVGASQALFGPAMKDRDAGVVAGQLVGQIAGSVGRAVVDDEDIGLRHRREDRLDDRADVLALVVGRNEHPDARGGGCGCDRVGRRDGGRHRFPGCKGVAGENTLSLPYPAGRLTQAAPEPRPRTFADARKRPEEPFRSDCGFACTGRFDHRVQEIRGPLARLATCAPATAGTATGSSTSRLPRLAFCASVQIPLRVQRLSRRSRTVSVKTAESVSISLAPPGKTDNRSGTAPREVTYPPLSARPTTISGVVHVLSTHAGWRHLPVRTAVNGRSTAPLPDHCAWRSQRS